MYLFFKLICNLEDYINDHVQFSARGRLGEILCLIPTLKSISNELVELVQFNKLFGFVEVDRLIQEMLLSRTVENKNLKRILIFKMFKIFSQKV